jgi:hypothetical protein
MTKHLPSWSLLALCLAMAAAVGGGLYEHVVLMPLWSGNPPASFAIIQPGTGVPQQRFWIPIHAAITVFFVAALAATWTERTVRRILLVGVASYALMRLWSAVYFIPEMLTFQQMRLDNPASADVLRRVHRWTSSTWWREPLDVLSFLSSLLALTRFVASNRSFGVDQERRV